MFLLITFLFPDVGRMDDIWGGYYALAKGHKVIYNKATVYQDRNVHDLTKDMKNEYLGYENNLHLLESIRKNPEDILNFLPDSSKHAFVEYRKLFK